MCQYARSSVYDGTHQLSRLVLDGEGNRLYMEQWRDIRCDRYGEGRFLGPKIVVRFDFPSSDLRLPLLGDGACLGETSPPPWFYHPVQRRSLRRSGLTAEETVCSPGTGDVTAYFGD